MNSLSHSKVKLQTIISVFPKPAHINSIIGATVSALSKSKSASVTILNPQVHLLGDDAASIGYIKVTQTLDK